MLRIERFQPCKDSRIKEIDVHILVMNGPNLGVLGKRQPEIYGSQTMSDLSMMLDKIGCTKKVELSFFQSNHEGAMIDRLEEAYREKIDGIVLNAGAFTHTSLALADCLAWINIPCVEVHISNVLARTDSLLRHQSLIAKYVIGVISGFGVMSYALAVLALVNRQS